jgi:hypothetical protein
MSFEGARARVGGATGLAGGGVTSGELATAIAGLAPGNATYITQTANGTLSAEQALADLSTGILKVTTTTGVLSTATGSDLPSHSHTGVPFTLQFNITSGDATVEISDGAKPDAEVCIPVDCTITSYSMVGTPITGQTSGSAVVDLLSNTLSAYPTSVSGGTSICASEKPTISSAVKDVAVSVSGWTTGLNDTDFLKPEVESCTNLASIRLTLFCTRTV